MAKYKAEFFDLETCPAPIDHLLQVMPEFSAPKGWKDEEKIKAHVDQQREAWIDDAALSPLTGGILAAIWIDVDGKETIWDSDIIGEKAVIIHLLDRMRRANMGAYYKVVGFNVRSFDIPFIVKRAWKHGVTLPSGLLRVDGKWINLPKWIIDLRDLWGMDERFPVGSLDVIARWLRVGEKVGEGRDFHKLWRDPERKIEGEVYIRNDGRMLQRIFNHLMSLSPDGYGLNLQESND